MFIAPGWRLQRPAPPAELDMSSCLLEGHANMVSNNPLHVQTQESESKESRGNRSYVLASGL